MVEENAKRVNHTTVTENDNSKNKYRVLELQENSNIVDLIGGLIQRQLVNAHDGTYRIAVPIISELETIEVSRIGLMTKLPLSGPDTFMYNYQGDHPIYETIFIIKVTKLKQKTSHVDNIITISESGTVYSETTRKERNGFHDNSKITDMVGWHADRKSIFKVLTFSAKTLTEKKQRSHVECLTFLIARPTSSEANWMKRYGNARRETDGKTNKKKRIKKIVHHTCPVTGITGKINSSSGVGSSSSSSSSFPAIPVWLHLVYS